MCWMSRMVSLVVSSGSPRVGPSNPAPLAMTASLPNSLSHPDESHPDEQGDRSRAEKHQPAGLDDKPRRAGLFAVSAVFCRINLQIAAKSTDPQRNSQLPCKRQANDPLIGWSNGVG